ncbi:MAG: hypothetical protein IMZ61_04705 [Planctomycetes bacterium]|nr:hypothetical protein [Planctomycetota bacterium]
MIGFSISPSQIDYSKILESKQVENLIVGECVIITGFAKELAPVKEGQFKNSIMWRMGDKEGGFNQGGDKPAPGKIAVPPARTGHIGSHLEYAGPIEWGRVDMPNYPRQPTFRPAIDYSRKQREDRRKRIIDKAIRDARKPGE